MRKLFRKLFKRLFKKHNMLRIYATRKENEVHDLRGEIHELEAEMLNMKIELNNKDKLIVKLMNDRDLLIENLTPKKKEKLAELLNEKEKNS